MRVSTGKVVHQAPPPLRHGSPVVARPAPSPPVVRALPAANRLARAQRLGHRIQRAVGFELELQVLLTAGPQQVEGSDLLPQSIGDLTSGKIAPRKKVRETRHRVTLPDRRVFEWREESGAEPDGETVLALAGKEGLAGRWHARPVKDEKDRYFDPLLKKEDKIHQEALVEVVEDHSSAQLQPDRRLSSLIELVTKPRDEFGNPQEFLAPIVRAQELAAEVVKRTGSLEHRIPASAIFPSARPDLYLGFELDDIQDRNASEQRAAAAVQATYGLRLGSLPGWISHLLKGPERTLKGESDILAATLKAVATMEKALSSIGYLTGPDPGFLGFLAAVSLYLSGGRKETLGENPKNYVALLNRSGLHTFVGEAGFIGIPGTAILTDLDRRAKLKELLIESNQRNEGEPVLVSAHTSPKIGDWLNGVLAGTGDSMRSFDRFGRARIIEHEQVGPTGGQSLAPVFEERQVPGGRVKNRPELIPIADWQDMAGSYLERLQPANSPEPTKEKQPETFEQLPSLDQSVKGALSGGGETKLEPRPLQEQDRVRVLHRKTGKEVAVGSFLRFASKIYAVKIESFDPELNLELGLKCQKGFPKGFNSSDYDVVAIN